MASLINSGESLFIPFRDGHSISDSQLKPRMYKSKEAFQKNFPGYYKGTEGVELAEYAPVVRCKECIYRKKRVCANPTAGMWVGVELKENDFCSYGERKENDT